MITDPRTDADMTDLYGTDWDNMNAEEACRQADFDDYCRESLRAQLDADYWHTYNRGWNP